MKIILPKERYEWREQDGPLFFLAGPVRGGGEWQAACCEILARHCKDFCAAIPCRWTEQHRLSGGFAKGISTFDYQLEWERYYLELASRKGCILFWLPVERPEMPSDDPPKAYARDTRGELGEWRGRMMRDTHIRLVVGAEPGFDGLDVIQRNFESALRVRFPIYGTLAETCRAAVYKE